MNISEAARLSGLSSRMIRHYEKLGLLNAAKRSENGYRQYSHNDLERLRFIQRARGLDFSLEDIGQLLNLWQNPDRASADVKALAAQQLITVRQRLAELQALEQQLLQLHDTCQGNNDPNCPILQALANPTT